MSLKMSLFLIGKYHIIIAYVVKSIFTPLKVSKNKLNVVEKVSLAIGYLKYLDRLLNSIYDPNLVMNFVFHRAERNIMAGSKQRPDCWSSNMF